jgi:3-deoxy-D-manno-octulosonic-acid transferase
VQVHLGALERMIELRYVVEQEAGTGGVCLDHQRLVFELVEVLFNVLVAGLGLHLDWRQRAGHRNLFALTLRACHQSFHVLRSGRINPVSSGGIEQDARIFQRDGLVAIVADNEPHRHHAMAQVVDTKDRFLLLGVVGFDGNGNVFFLVNLDCGKRRGGLNRWRCVVTGCGRDCGNNDQEQQRANDVHRARLYHLRVRPLKREFRHAMILFFYNLALFAALLAGAPWWLWRLATTQKYREGLSERLGRVPSRLRPTASRAEPVIWLHAVSVGEVLAISRLVQEIAAAFPGYLLMISTTTRTGQELARTRFGPDRVFYCPLDLPWAVRAYLNALQPRMLILAETEFWPNLLNECFRRDIPVAVVNARISDRSWPRYQMLRRLWNPILSRISRVLAQSSTDAERLVALGCLPERVSVSGNLKFDVRAGHEAEANSLLKTLGPALRFLVAGSTLEGEETALLEAWPRLLSLEPQLVMVLAPRHPERFGAVATLLEAVKFSWIRRSQWKSKPASSLAFLEGGQIVLLDTIGELASVYSLATVAFVGGSLVAAGGHNPLEPAQFGVPIVMGPNYANFRTITEDLRAHNAIRIARKDDLAATLGELLSNREEAQKMGARAKQVFEEKAGATARSIDALREMLHFDADEIVAVTQGKAAGLQ